MDTSTEISYPYQGCVTGMYNGGWVHRYSSVPSSFVGAELCASKCKEGGYKYWGLECPGGGMMACQCGLEGMLNAVTFIDDQKCKEYNNGDLSAAHCVGPFTSSLNGMQYLHGAAHISSVYLTEKSG